MTNLDEHPTPTPKKPRKPGGWEGQVVISEDFDAPLPDDIQAAFEGRSLDGRQGGRDGPHLSQRPAG
jgi:hypothetical protein